MQGQLLIFYHYWTLLYSCFTKTKNNAAVKTFSARNEGWWTGAWTQRESRERRRRREKAENIPSNTDGERQRTEGQNGEERTRERNEAGERRVLLLLLLILLLLTANFFFFFMLLSAFCGTDTLSACDEGGMYSVPCDKKNMKMLSQFILDREEISKRDCWLRNL